VVAGRTVVSTSGFDREDDVDQDGKHFYVGDRCSEDEYREFQEVWEGISELQRCVLRSLAIVHGRPVLDWMEEFPELVAPLILTRSIAREEISRDVARILSQGGSL
jgi:hypothetical protein